MPPAPPPPLVPGSDFDAGRCCTNPLLVGRQILMSCEVGKDLPTELFTFDLGKVHASP